MDSLNDSVIRSQLVAKNPFASSAAPNPWDNANPDLDSLNRTVVDHIDLLLKMTRENPAETFAGLILGEAGAGKTHMLKRVLRRIRESGEIAIFVTVRAFMDPESVMQDLLREVFISMGREHGDGKLQIDLLLEALDKAYRRDFREDALGGMARLEPLQMKLDRVNNDFLRCLLLYASTEDASLKNDILRWMRGESDESFSEKLDVIACNWDEMTPAAQEKKARDRLLSLGHVLRYVRVPMLVCFDQLDGMTSEDLLNAWGTAASLLINDVYGVLPLAFLRADTWEQRFSPRLDDAVRQKFLNHRLPMANCNLEQAKQLIKERIKAFFDDDDEVEQKYQWLMARLNTTLKPGYSPRMVITLANQAIQEAGDGADAAHEVEHALAEAYREECDKVASDPNSWPPNANHLLSALEMWLGAHPEIKVSRSADKYLRLSGKRSAEGLEAPCAFIVMTTRHHRSAAAAISRGIKFLEENPNGFCCYVTDERALKGPENWKQVHELLGQFRALKGRTVVLQPDGRAAWYGLVAFQNKVCNGDVTLYPPSGGPRLATPEDLSGYMKEGFRLNLLGLDGESRKPGDGDRSKDTGSGKDPTPSTSGPKDTSGSASEEERLPLPVAVNSELCQQRPQNGDCSNDLGVAPAPQTVPEKSGSESGDKARDDFGEVPQEIFCHNDLGAAPTPQTVPEKSGSESGDKARDDFGKEPQEIFCRNDLGAAPTPQTVPESSGSESGSKARDDLGKGSQEIFCNAEGLERMVQLLKALKDLGLSVADAGVVCGPCFIRLKVLPDAAKGTTVKKIDNRADDLQVQMALPVPPVIQAYGGYVGVDVPRSSPQALSLKTLLRQGEENRPRSEAVFPLGMRVDGSVFWADLAEPSMTSILIGGTSGSGKSVLLRSVVVGLLLCAPKDSVNFTLIDPKRVTFVDLAGLRALEGGRILCDVEETMEALKEAVEEMERRYELMEGAKVSHLTDYNAVAGERLRRRVLIIDEYADLMMRKETAKDLEYFIQRLCQKGRAAGFHLLLATQLPNAKIVTGVIKANLQLRVALKVASKSNSQIILGEGFTQAQHLLGHGDMLVGNGSSVERLQGPIADVSLLGPEFLRG